MSASTSAPIIELKGITKHFRRKPTLAERILMATGRGGPRDEAGAVALWDRAVAQGHVTARLNRGTGQLTARVETAQLEVGPDLAPVFAGVHPKAEAYCSRFSGKVTVRADLTVPGQADQPVKYDVRVGLADGRYEDPALPWPLDAAILGMGADGHTASFFPDAENLGALLDPASNRIVLPSHAPSAGEARLTLTAARIVEAKFLALHIEGQEKRAAFDEAMGGNDKKPVRAVFDAAPHAPEVFWAP